MQIQNISPLVSIIIPTYNHSHFILEAINSVKIQNYPKIEIIVVDDGSTDGTKEIVFNLPEIQYIYQTNQGLSTARNKGIENCNGEFLVFLDADDWLLPNSIETNVNYLLQNNNLAFVSGAHDKYYVTTQKSIIHQKSLDFDHYIQLLQSNHIAMIATVLFRRFVFNEFLFNSRLKACEDYDLYLKIARKYEIKHHNEKMAVYRFHNTNMTNNIPLILEYYLLVLENQKVNCHSKMEKIAFFEGKIFARKYYAFQLLKQMIKKQDKFNIFNIAVIVKNIFKLGIDYLSKTLIWVSEEK